MPPATRIVLRGASCILARDQVPAALFCAQGPSVAPVASPEKYREKGDCNEEENTPYDAAGNGADWDAATATAAAAAAAAAATRLE